MRPYNPSTREAGTGRQEARGQLRSCTVSPTPTRVPEKESASRPEIKWQRAALPRLRKTLHLWATGAAGGPRPAPESGETETRKSIPAHQPPKIQKPAGMATTPSAIREQTSHSDPLRGRAKIWPPGTLGPITGSPLPSPTPIATPGLCTPNQVSGPRLRTPP